MWQECDLGKFEEARIDLRFVWEDIQTDSRELNQIIIGIFADPKDRSTYMPIFQ
jgi:hypothetical protein